MPLTTRTPNGVGLPVAVGGPEAGIVVVIVGDAGRPPAAYGALCERLHGAGLRTVVIGLDGRLNRGSVVGLLDAMRIGWSVLVGDAAGAEVAWKLAAALEGRFVALVAIDPGAHGAQHQPPVWVDTTVLVSSPAALTFARGAQQLVHADYRVVDLAGRNPAEATAQVATEIVLRTSVW